MSNIGYTKKKGIVDMALFEWSLPGAGIINFKTDTITEGTLVENIDFESEPAWNKYQIWITCEPGIMKQYLGSSGLNVEHPILVP